MSVEQRQMWLRDWCEDLARFPADAVASACRKWRHSESSKFPTPGQLVPLVEASLPVEKGPKVEAWRPASEAEYAVMTVREKIRERTILASEAYGKAGPMFRNEGGSGLTRARGTHLPAEQMPPTHRHWRQVGDNHMAEVKRLREILHRPQSMAAE